MRIVEENLVYGCLHSRCIYEIIGLIVIVSSLSCNNRYHGSTQAISHSLHMLV